MIMNNKIQLAKEYSLFLTKYRLATWLLIIFIILILFSILQFRIIFFFALRKTTKFIFDREKIEFSND